MEPRNEEYHSAPQPVLQDHLDGMHTNTRPPPSFNMPENKPVHNFSIQTGEEFALEFMRDRVNVKKPSFPNVVSEPNYATGYMELKGILGHPGSESGPDISMLASIENVPKEFDRRNSVLHQERSNYGSARSIPRSSSNQDNNRVLHGISSSGGSDSLSLKMKILCSFGGRILPRPSDGKLRYVGGETRIISIRKDISWPELLQKISSIYNDTHAIKYQLPGEDLDALVSVSSDEDLRNMMEECHDLQRRRGSLKLRMFLFSINDLDDTQFGLGSMDGGDSEIQYVVAINGMGMESRSNSILRCAGSSNSIHELDRQNIDRETKRTVVESYGVGGSSLTGNVNSVLTNQSSQPMLPTSSNAYEAYPFFYEDPIIQQAATSQYPIHSGPFPSSSSARNLGEVPVSLPTHGLANQVIVSEGQASSEFQVQRKGDNVIHTANDRVKVLSTEAPYSLPSHPFEGSLQGNLSEAAVPVSVSEALHPALPLENKIPAVVSEALNPQISRSGEDDFYTASADAFSRALVDAESNVIDFSCLEPPPLPNRVYYSERIFPREQADLLNRSAKSDDAYGSHLLMSDLLSDLNHMNSVNESSDMLHNENLSNLNTASNSSAKPLRADSHIINKHLPDATSQANSKVYQLVDSDLKRVLSDNKISENETNASKDSPKVLQVDETKGSERLPFRRVPSVEHNVNQASKLQDNNLSEVPTREPLDAKSKPSQGDILIDIEDRFPRDFLYDMFSKAAHSEDSANISPLPADRAGLSLKMDNHEPKSWSYFQKLAHEGFDNNVSLIDQDNLGFSSAVSKAKEGDSMLQHSAPLPAESVILTGPKESHSHLNFGEENQKILPATTKTEAVVFQPENNPFELKGNENTNVSTTVENLRPQESEYQDDNSETRDVVVAPDTIFGEFDISTLQIIMNADLEELRELGSGTFGTVYHGKWRGSDVAIKRIKKSCFSGRSSEQERLTIEFWREADILSKLHHPNVVAFYGVVQDGPGGTMATVTEFMVDGSLRHVLLRKDRYLDRRKRLIIAMDAAFGMEYLHAKNIVHFDLKCDNLLVNLKDPLRPICKVGDFGLSKIKRNTLVTGGVRGTLPWMAPELLNGSSNKVSEKVDVFSFGIVLWEILTGEEPYANMHYGAIIGGIVNNTLRPTIPGYCDIEWRTLMEQCWAPNPAVRPSFTEIARRLRVMSAAAIQTKGQGHKASK
jgi:tRNA A-37 threonylcarbamoyl transferase component Bud32